MMLNAYNTMFLNVQKLDNTIKLHNRNHVLKYDGREYSKGWMCGECEKFRLGHGCFNLGALLWHKSEGMELILKVKA